MKPWTEATRISAISCAEKPDETDGSASKAYAIVNRLGIISMQDDKFDLYVDSNGIVRSRTVFKTKGGKFQQDKNGNKILE